MWLVKLPRVHDMHCIYLQSGGVQDSRLHSTLFLSRGQEAPVLCNNPMLCLLLQPLLPLTHNERTTTVLLSETNWGAFEISPPWFFRPSLHVWTLPAGCCSYFWCYFWLMWSETGSQQIIPLDRGTCHLWEISSLELTLNLCRRWGKHLGFILQLIFNKGQWICEALLQS